MSQFFSHMHSKSGSIYILCGMFFLLLLLLWWKYGATVCDAAVSYRKLTKNGTRLI